MRRYEGEGRAPWPWWRRRAHAFACWFYKFFVTPFLDAQGDGSMPAWGVAGILTAMILRLVSHDPIGWPDAFIVFFAFLGLPLYEAAMTVARLNPEKLLDVVVSRMGIGDVAHGGLTGPANDGVPGGDRD